MTTLYFGDNGRITCAKPRCAGATASSSGMTRDLSGGPMDKITDDDAKYLFQQTGLVPACEGCGAGWAD